jgi:hypothetical protein
MGIGRERGRRGLSPLSNRIARILDKLSFKDEDEEDGFITNEEICVVWA